MVCAIQRAGVSDPTEADAEAAAAGANSWAEMEASEAAQERGALLG